jgi:hypothetical protein
MPIEKPPLKHLQLPVDYQPPRSVPYKVKDFDAQGRPETWKTVAEEHSLNVDWLIHFNFKTNNSDEVNWYLRRNVGCNVPTPDGLNWTFSSSAKPGIIYLPIQRLNMEPIDMDGKKTISPLALEFEGPSAPLGTLGKLFDCFALLDMGLSIAGVAFGGALMLGVGIVIAPMTNFVALGGLAEAPLNELRKQQILEGLSLGIVLTADGRSVQYVREQGYVKFWPVRDIHFPQYGKQLQGIYNQALVAGIAHGRQFNTVAAGNLFKWIGSQMTDYAQKEYVGRESASWDARKWENYYRLCAAILQRKIVLR